MSTWKFKNSLANVVAITGDNCSTNLLFAKVKSTPFVGSAIHQLNLAVHAIMRNQDAIIQKENKIMKKTENTYFNRRASEFHGVESQDVQ